MSNETVTDLPILGVDVGATRIKAGLVQADGSIEAQRTVWLDDGDRSEVGIIDRVVAVIGDLDPDRRTTRVGVGVPGAVRWPHGIVTSSPNFPRWSDFALKDRLEERLGRSVVVDNDANAVIWGAWRLGGFRPVRSLVGFTLGTGVGGALILKGELYRGRDGMAGEVGHITVEPEGPACGCGGRGCLEMYASRVGLRQACLDVPVDGVDPDDPRLPEVLADRAREGDALAQAAFVRAGRALGQVMAGMVNTLNVETILIAGGIAPAFEWMRATALRELEARSYPAAHRDLEVVVAPAKELAGIVGSALLVDA